MDYDDEDQQSYRAKLDLPSIKPIDVKAHQLECAKNFGYNFDLSFPSLPEKTPL